MKDDDEIGANQFVQGALKNLLCEIENTRRADVMTIFTPLYPPIDDKIRSIIEHIKTRRKTLLVILETSGGFIEVVQRIVHTMRRHYQRVEFLVPNHAMSAGTVLTLSGDDILMDYYGVLGPIDPQIRPRSSAIRVPALGYLAQYERLIKKAENGNLSTAEMAILLQFDQAELYLYEQAKSLSVRLLKQWLVKYKFKNWKKTQTRGIIVTRSMKSERAEKIANSLNNVERWHSHGQGISMQVFHKDKDLKLQITDFGKDKKLSDMVKEYYTLLSDYIMQIGGASVIQTREEFVPIRWS